MEPIQANPNQPTNQFIYIYIHTFSFVFFWANFFLLNFQSFKKDKKKMLNNTQTYTSIDANKFQCFHKMIIFIGKKNLSIESHALWQIEKKREEKPNLCTQ